MMDLEFTIEQGKLWMLQTRVGKRTALSALKVAIQMYEEGRISKEEAVMRVAPEQLDQLLHPQFDPKADYKVIAKARVPPSAPSCSPPLTPRPTPRPASPASSCAGRPRPTTSTAWLPPRAS